MNISEAQTIVGGLTKTTKMPCLSYSIPAEYCRNGSKFRQNECTVCHFCYAYERNNYTWPTVKNAQQRRYARLLNVLTEPKRYWDEYIDAFVTLLRNQEYFRWHDSGDLVNPSHLHLICEICTLTPNVMHRLPTKEFSVVDAYRTMNVIPSNLNIQLSSPILNNKIDRNDFQIATVYRSACDLYESGDFICNATIPDGDHRCGSCRECWTNKNDIGYLLH